ASFWLGVDDGGGNIRVYAADGVTLIPHDCSSCNLARKTGKLYVKADLSASSNTTLEIALESSGTAALAVGDANGRNAVWSDYEVVWAFPGTDNRTGKGYAQTLGNVPYSEWTRTRYHEFTGNPHQGIAVDSTGRLITIDTNYFRRHSTSNLSTLLASNSTPVADAGLPVVNHCGDACIIGSELFVPLEEYPRTVANNQHIAVYNADTLAFIRSYDISANGHPADGIAYDGTDLWVIDFNDDTNIYRYSLTGVLLETVTLSVPLIQIQGVEVMDGLLYLSVTAAGNPIYEVQTDGTVNGVVYNRPTDNINEGLSFDGEHLWIMAGDGGAEELVRDPDRTDWIKLHYDNTWADVDPLSTTWTMATSVYWTSLSGDEQQAFLALGTLLDNSGRAMVLYDEGPDVLSMWNSSDSFQGSGFNPSSNSTFRTAGSQDGTTRRKLWKDGQVQFTDSPIAARPVSGSGKTQFIINASRTDGQETAEAYYQFVWLRHEEMSDAWMSADNANTQYPSEFYLPIAEKADGVNVSALAIVNPGAEAGDMTGWTVVGAFTVEPLVGASGPLGPFRGSYLFGGGVGATSSASQVVVIEANSIAKIDTGAAKLNFSWRQTSYAGFDEGDVEIEFLDGAGLSLGAPFGLGLSASPGQVWEKREHAGVSLPMGTRRVRITMKTNRHDGGYSNGHFDALLGAIY
ncbi:MAG: hypothetical protein COB08_012120, partial [Rhodobacteraceae bacterium]|nr:hypothetical protein [Paracoccaceae bacterium]